MKKGFTLIEMIVAIGLFGIASTIVSGMLLSMISVQRKSIAIRGAMDNLGFASEIMSKDIRTGSGYVLEGSSCGSNCGTAFHFTSAYDVANSSGALVPDGTPDTVYYSVNAGRFEKRLNGGAPVPLSAPEVKVDRLRFYATGLGLLDNMQPLVVIVIGASAGKDFDTKINLQTSISQRRIDY